VFEVRTEDGRNGVVVIRLAGEVDLTVSSTLEATLLDAVAQGSARQIVVDLGQLRFLDSSGVHALVKGYHAAKTAGASLIVRNATGIVARVLRITGVGQALGMPVVAEEEQEEYPRGA
jgi:anti-sigma B factor antagonist